MTKPQKPSLITLAGLFLFIFSAAAPNAFAVIRDGNIDPANLGKGEWIYIMKNATNKLGGNVPAVTNEASLMSFYTNQGVRYVIVKAGTGSAEFNGEYTFPQFNTNLVAKAHDVGLLIFAYTRSYGLDISGEIALATTCFNKGADGFVIDAEAEWEEANLPNNYTKATQLSSGIRSNWPTKFLAHAPFAIISGHSTFPYKEFGYYCDAAMPQIYYSAWSGVKSRASGAINWTDVNWRNWQNSLTGNWTNSIKPIVPVTTVYGPLFSSVMPDYDVMEFIDFLNADPDSPVAGGYQGMNVWEGYMTGSNQWANIKKSTIGNFPGIVRNIVIDSATATTVGSWTSTRTFYNGTYYGVGTDTNSFGTNYFTKAQGNGSAYVQFTPNIVEPGNYDVYQWHPYLSTASTNVPHVINFNGGWTTVYANQTTNAGRWTLLGRFNFAVGTSGNVQVKDNVAEPSKVPIADGIKFVFADTNAPGPVPAAPSGLTALALSYSQIKLTWTDNATNETSLIVARGTTSGGPYTDVATLAANSTTYTNSGLAPGSTYCYVVRAANANGSSANSAEASATTLTGPASQFTGSLKDRIIYATGGHGWTWYGDTYGWTTQRGVYLGMEEDYGNIDQLNFFVPYMFNAGATIAACGRPIGFQTNEVVLSHTNASGVTFSGSWSVNTTDTVYFRGSTSDRFRYASLNATETATASYTPTIPMAGFYPVYTWVPHGADRGNQLYRILHTGGEMQVRVPHYRVGNGWVYLGTYYFNAGANTNGAVVVSNLRGSTNGSIVIADAMRFGNGMGSIVRGTSISGYPREEECCRYWVQNSLGAGQSSSLYDYSSDDGSDSVTAATRMAAEMNREAGGTMFKRLFLSFHSNSDGGGNRGDLGLYNNTSLFPGTATPNQQTYAGIIGTNVHWALKTMTVPPYEYLWTNNFASPYTFARSDYAFGEINNSYGINSEFDATILEVGFHDDVYDAPSMRDPKFRDLTARGCYNAVVRYMNAKDTVDTVPLTFLPTPVTNLRAVAATNGVTLTWNAPASVAGSGAPTNYVIYRSANGYGFGTPTWVGGTATNYTLTDLPTDTDFYFRVCAVNVGGESLPSEVAGCRRSSAPGAPKVLYVRGFDRFDRTQNLRQRQYVTNYIPPGPGTNGMMERVIARQNNSFDYVVQHGKSLSAGGWAFDSCARQAVTNGLVALGNYAAVIWGCGQETNNVLTIADQNKLKAYVTTNNGALFISGADIAWGLGRASGPSASDRAFLTNQLHCSFPTDNHNNSSNYTLNASASGIFAGNASGEFDNGTKAIYWVQQPDVLTPTGAGASAAITYGSGTTAAIQYDGSVGGGRVVFLGFPFETITSAAVRDAYMADIMSFLAVPAPPVAPSITTQPQSQTVPVGANATFTVAATGTAPLYYQWRFNSADISGATADSYTRVNCQPGDGGNYTVVITNSVGSVTSAVAVLTVSTSVAPSITTQPQSQSVAQGASATFTVTATGTTPLSYQWRFNTANISGATASSYTRVNCQPGDAGNYTVVVTNVAGSVTSAVATLTVSTSCGSATLLNPSFELGNVSGVATNWTGYRRTPYPTTVWSIQTASPPAGAGLQYQQMANTSSTGGGGVRQDITGCAVGATYTIAGWYRGNSATYSTCRVRVSRTASTNWSTAVDLSPVAAYTGSTWTSFSGTVVASNSTITLWLDGQTTGTGQNKAECFDGISISCSTPPTVADIILDNTNAAVSFTAGWSTGNSATDRYGADYRWTDTISGSPTETATYRPNIVTAGNYDIYVWYPQGSNRATNAPWTVSFNGGSVTVPVNQQINGGAWFLIASARNFAAGTNGTIQLANNTGSSGQVVIADAVKLVYSSIQGGPSITQQPAATNLCAGGNASFTVAATGQGTLTYQWQKSLTNISNGGHYSGVTTTTLVVTGADSTDVANYRCVVTDTSGSTASSEAALGLKTGTTITTQPSNQSVASGGTVYFTVAATGDGTLTYQWQKNSNNITDGGHYSGCTTATLTVSSADANDVASYRCVVTGGCGSATSANATLTITSCSAATLLNSSFELGNISGVATNWTGYQRTPYPTTSWSIQTASPPTGTGTNYQQMANTSSTGGGGVRQDVTGCTIGATYTIAGWYRGNSASATCTVKVSPTASTTWSTAVDLSPAATYSGSTWTSFSGTVVATGTSMTLWLDGQTGGTGLNKAECFDGVTVTCYGQGGVVVPVPLPLVFESVSLLPGNQVRLTLSGEPGSSVTIYRSSDLVNWTPLTTLITDSGALEFTDSSAAEEPQRFYRATAD